MTNGDHLKIQSDVHDEDDLELFEMVLSGKDHHLPDDVRQFVNEELKRQ